MDRTTLASGGVTFGPDVWEGGTQSVTSPLLADAYAVTTDRYGNIWITLRDSNKIGRIDPSCNTLTISLGTPPAGTTTTGPSGIAALPDGTIWFTEFNSGKIGKIVQTDRAHPALAGEYPLPGSGSQPLGIARGSDGALWFTEYAAAKIGRMVPTSNAVTEYALPSGHHPKWIAAQSRLMVFTEDGYGLGTITMAGVITENKSSSGESEGSGLTVSSDGTTVYSVVKSKASGTATVQKFTVSTEATATPAETGVITPSADASSNMTTNGTSPTQLAQDKLGRVWYTDSATSSVAIAGDASSTVAAATSPVAIGTSPSGNVIYVEAAGTVRVGAQDVASAAVTTATPGVGAGGGCASDSKAGFDPTLPGLLGGALVFLRRRFRKQ